MDVRDGLPRLVQLFPTEGCKDDTSIDIIAVHGIETHSPKTWIAYEQDNEPRGHAINWLCDENMLPKVIPQARIWAYDYNSNCYSDNAQQVDILGLGETFLEILWRAKDKDIGNRLLIFIGSCFGGVVVAQAIERASRDLKYADLLRSTTGVIFLGTPLRGTATASIAEWVALIRGFMGRETSTSLLQSLKDKASSLDTLIHDFSKMARVHNLEIRCFFETRTTQVVNALSRRMARLSLFSEVKLVPKESACLDGHDRFPLDVRHAMMNKFRGPEDVNFKLVSGSLKEIAENAVARPDATFLGHSNQGLQVASNSRHVHVEIHGLDSTQQERCLDKLSNVTQAAFDSFERQYDPICQQNTRVDVLNEIRAWADGEDERRIYWLNGLAGTGKSTIARTIAREYSEHGRLGASFFFSKGGGDVGHARKFVTTIAFQLAKKSSLRSYICGAVSENNDIKDKSLRDQWHQLIRQPFSRLDGNCSRSSYVLVIDALDECEGQSDIRTILHLLTEVRSLKLRVFLTSRPEIPIRHGFDQISDAEHQDFVLHNISPPIIDHDIYLFLEHNFKLIREESSLDAGWPGEHSIKRLLQKASGLFIWAATACRFVRDGKRFAVQRLARILEDNMGSTTAPDKHLNKIYITVLQQSVNFDLEDEEREDMYLMLRKILGSIVALLSPLSADSLCRLLHIADIDVSQTLEDLHAILDIPKDQTRPLQLHHPSFRDFLFNKEKCCDPNFCVDEKQMHQYLADNSIRLMEDSLKQDICSLDTYGVSVNEIESSRMQQCLPQAVQYACLYWIQHLQRSCSQLYDGGQVHQFLQTHTLHWLEALSWMRKVSDGIRAIASLESIALQGSSCHGLYAFIHDIKRFTLYNRPAIEQAPLQVYCSALIFAPMTSLVKKQFENCTPRWIKILSKTRKDSSAVLQSLEGHLTPVTDVAFSPDGKVLASAASLDLTVKLWDASTGGALQTFTGTSLWMINAVAFSLDGKMLVSESVYSTVKRGNASTGGAQRTLRSHSLRVRAVALSPDGTSALDNRTVKLWDASTGGTLNQHFGSVSAVAFSPDGMVVASASNDGTVKLWDASTGRALQTLQCRSSTVAFSPDSKVLASILIRSNDKTVKLWDANTGGALKTLKGHFGPVSAVVFSPDGTVVASASNDGTVKLWDASTGGALQTLQCGSSTLAFSPDGKVLASTSIRSNDKTVKLWDASTGGALKTLKGHFGPVNAVAFSPDGKVLASASEDETIKLWDASTEGAQQILESHSLRIRAVALSPDGKALASASDDRTVKLWDASTGGALQTLEGHSDGVGAVAFSPDGKVLASASDDRTVKLWDASTGGTLQTLNRHFGSVDAVAFSPDGMVVASASSDGTVMLWDAITGGALQTLEIGPAPIKTISFTDDRTPAPIKTISFINDGTLPRTDLPFTHSMKLLIRTDRGMLRATLWSPTTSLEILLAPGIYVKEQWITRDMKNIIWLPTEYRPTCSAVHGNVIALGHESGRLSLFELAF